jgi:hypothetical protein
MQSTAGTGTGEEAAHAGTAAESARRRLRPLTLRITGAGTLEGYNHLTVSLKLISNKPAAVIMSY